MKDGYGEVVVLLGSDFHVRSFFAADLYTELSSKFKLTIGIARNVKRIYIPTGIPYIDFSITKRAESLFVYLLDASLIRNLKKSKSFAFRLRRYLLGDYQRFIFFSPSGLLRLIRSALMAIPGPYFCLKYMYSREVMKDFDFNNYVEAKKPKLILTWANSIEPSTMLAITLAKKFRNSCQSIAVFDNWDNLSSKAVLIETPDQLVCFGQQSKDLAVRIHNIEPSRIHPIGSARFETHSKFSRNVISERKSVLIAGSSIALEDFYVLNAIDEILQSQHKDAFLQGFKFFYRPHPLPQGMSIDLQNWRYKNVQIEENEFSADNQHRIWQSQSDLSKALAKYKVVIAAPTTLLLEALICGSYVIIPALDAPGIKTSIRKMLSQLEHLKGIELIEGVSIVKSPEDLLIALMSSLKSNNPIESSDSIHFFVHQGNESFGLRLSSLLISLLE